MLRAILVKGLSKLVSLIDVYREMFQDFGQCVFQQTPEGPASES